MVQEKRERVIINERRLVKFEWKEEGGRESYESTIKSGNEDELAIRGELGERNSRRLVINQSLQASPFLGIPYLTGPIVTPRHNQGPVAIEMHARNRHRVSLLNDAHAPPRLHLPDPNRLIERTGHDQIRGRVEVNAEDEVGVASQHLETLVGSPCVPDPKRAVVRGRARVVRIGGPC